MTTIAMSGNDTVVISGRTLTDFATGTYAELTYPNELAAVKTGKNGNSIYGLNETGNQADVKVSVIRASGDDKFLNGLLTQQMANFASFVLLNGSFVKLIGNGQGAITEDTYIVGGGIYVKRVEAKSNAEGDTDQSIAIYTMRFANSPRVLT